MVLTPNPTKPADGPFSILIADDDRGNRETLRDVLADRGFRPVVAADGAEAVEIVQVQTIHLVFFDVHMPRLTGLEALQFVRQFNELLPAILMTADATRELIRQAFQAHAFTVLPKPVNLNLLVQTLNRALATAYGPPQPPAATPTGPPQP